MFIVMSYNGLVHVNAIFIDKTALSQFKSVNLFEWHSCPQVCRLHSFLPGNARRPKSPNPVVLIASEVDDPIVSGFTLNGL